MTNGKYPPYTTNHEQSLKEYQSAGLDYVYVSRAHNSCDNCKNFLAKKRLSVKDALAEHILPYSECTNTIGYCRCVYIADWGKLLS